MLQRTRFSGYRTTLIALAACALIITACDKNDDDDNNAPNSTITDVVVNTDSYSTLETALVKADLQNTLSGSGPFTLFAPDNATFTASGLTPDVLNTLSTAQARTILLYHTLNSKVMSGEVPVGPNVKVTTASGDSIFVTCNSIGLYINGVRVEEADIAASNGVIHRISRVLQPPVGTLIETAAVTPDFDSLVKAVTRAATAPGGDPTLASTLGNATLTVFAPTNAAFTQWLSSLSLTDINQIPIATLLAVLRHHVVPGRFFTSDFYDNPFPTMLSGGRTTVDLTQEYYINATITGNSNDYIPSNILKPNIMTRNGVIHVIDRVLLQ